MTDPMTLDTKALREAADYAKIEGHLRRIADAGRCEDGSDIPLGEQCREAADAIAALRKKVDDFAAMAGEFKGEATIAEAELSRLREERDRMREALEPFAKIDLPERDGFLLYTRYDIRAARRAYEGGGDA